jgi:hypothetical protein
MHQKKHLQNTRTEIERNAHRSPEPGIPSYNVRVPRVSFGRYVQLSCSSFIPQVPFMLSPLP